MCAAQAEVRVRFTPPSQYVTCQLRTSQCVRYCATTCGGMWFCTSEEVERRIVAPSRNACRIEGRGTWHVLDTPPTIKQCIATFGYPFYAHVYKHECFAVERFSCAAQGAYNDQTKRQQFLAEARKSNTQAPLQRGNHHSFARIDYSVQAKTPRATALYPPTPRPPSEAPHRTPPRPR